MYILLLIGINNCLEQKATCQAYLMTHLVRIAGSADFTQKFKTFECRILSDKQSGCFFIVISLFRATILMENETDLLYSIVSIIFYLLCKHYLIISKCY